MAYYYWRPTAGRDEFDLELDPVLDGYPIGSERHETTGSGRVPFVGRTHPSSHVRAGEGEARVLISVFSTRRTQPDILLNCYAFDDKLSVAASKSITIHYSPIG